MPNVPGEAITSEAQEVTKMGEEPELSALRQRLDIARAELMAANSGYAKTVEAMNGDKKLADLAAEVRKAEAALKSTEDARQEVWNRARKQVLVGKSFTALFTRATAPGKEQLTNIRNDVLSAIKNNMDFDVLTDYDIQRIAEELINRFASADPVYMQRVRQYSAAMSAKAKAADDYFKYAAQYNIRPVSDLRLEIDRLEKLLANPKAAVASEKRRKELAALPAKLKKIFDDLESD